ncbi:MAG: ribosome maturation factor RimM [Calothrix sp. MO_167.B42]|nr:ribosome maturation factor RimM [Calothrix sp. MO_167.B42]
MDEWLEIGKIVAPQGLHGEMRVYPETDFPERFEVPGTRWLLRPGEKTPVQVELLKGRYLSGKKLYVIKLEGIENRDRVEELRGSKLMVPASDRPTLNEDEYHVLDLIGVQVYLQETGELVGTVVDVMTTGHDLLEVEVPREEGVQQQGKKKTKSKTNILIPFVKAIVPVVDLTTRRIEITPPPGLLEIN